MCIVYHFSGLVIKRHRWKWHSSLCGALTFLALYPRQTICDELRLYHWQIKAFFGGETSQQVWNQIYIYTSHERRDQTYTQGLLRKNKVSKKFRDDFCLQQTELHTVKCMNAELRNNITIHISMPLMQISIHMFLFLIFGS